MDDLTKILLIKSPYPVSKDKILLHFIFKCIKIAKELRFR